MVELRRYLDISRRWWWLVGVALLATTAVTVASVAFETPTYESSATFLVRPRTDDAAQDARAFDPLVRGVTINTTYASIARSDLIRDRAERQLDPAARADQMSVSAKVLTDTNIVSVSVRGPDPDRVFALAEAISAETVEYVNGLSDVYVLQSLDEPTRPDGPVATNRLMTISIGVVLGLTLGVGMALLGDYLRNGPATQRSREITCKRCSTTFERRSNRGPAPDYCDACKLVRKKERLNQLAVNGGRKPPYPDPEDGRPLGTPNPRELSPDELEAERPRVGAGGRLQAGPEVSPDGSNGEHDGPE